MEPDLTQAAAYIDTLTGEDGWSTPMTWQCLPTERFGVKEGRFWSGVASLEECGQRLEWLNRKGSAVFLVVNVLNGRRRDENITGLRAAFCDFDQPRQRDYALMPTMIVQSRRGEHAYWRLPADTAVKAFRPLQEQLAAYYSSDRSVANPSRTMRVPGFLHWGGNNPLLVQLEWVDAVTYSAEQVRRSHPATVHRRAPRSAPRSVREFYGWIQKIPTDRGSRNVNAFRIAAEGLRRGVAPDEVQTLVRDFCHKAGIAQEAATVFRSACRYHQRRING